MATMIRLGGHRGLNIEQVVEWTFRSTRPAPPTRATGGARSAEADVTPEAESSPSPVLQIIFAGGHVLEVTGAEALALQRYFCTVGGSV